MEKLIGCGYGRTNNSSKSLNLFTSFFLFILFFLFLTEMEKSLRDPVCTGYLAEKPESYQSRFSSGYIEKAFIPFSELYLYLYLYHLKSLDFLKKIFALVFNSLINGFIKFIKFLFHFKLTNKSHWITTLRHFMVLKKIGNNNFINNKINCKN